MKLLKFLWKHFLFITALTILGLISYFPIFKYLYYDDYTYRTLVLFVILLIWKDLYHSTNWSFINRLFIFIVNSVLHILALIIVISTFYLLIFNVIQFEIYRFLVLLLVVLLLLWSDIEYGDIAGLFKIKKYPSSSNLGFATAPTIPKLPSDPTKSVVEGKQETSKRAKAQFDIGESLVHQFKWAEAIPYLKRALDIDCKYWLPAASLGFIYGENPQGISVHNLEQSLFYSTLATKLNQTHYNQYVNLALAQLHTESKILAKNSFSNFDFALDIINKDLVNRDKPYFLTEVAKINIFKSKASENIFKTNTKAIALLKKGIKQINNCPPPISAEANHWLNDAQNNLLRLQNQK